MNRIQKGILLAGLCMGVGSLPATEYFVAIQGDDQQDGRAADQAFRTVQRG